MDFTLEIVPTEAYYRDYYRGWAAQKWLRRNESYLGVVMLLFWCGLRYVDGSRALGTVPYFFMALGLYETFKPLYRKHRWLRERTSSRVHGQKITARFSDDGIRVAGPFSSGNMTWAGIQKIQQTPVGLFLIPANGVSLFLPNSAFASAEQMQDLLARGGTAGTA